MDLCPQCGEPLMAGAKSCAKCGWQPGEAGGAHDGEQRSLAGRLGPGSWLVVIFAVSLLVGVAGAAVFWHGGPESKPAPSESAKAAAKRERALPASMAAMGGLPAGHPKVMSSTGGRIGFVAEAEKEAEAKPQDVKAWDLFGDLALRATIFSPSYYDKAEKAYSHALKIDPNDPDALKGMGNIDYDRHRYGAATAAYERYLRAKPEDPRVLTDLGTMYLAKKNIGHALELYRKALAIEPDLFAARFNAGVAYLLQNDKADARAELKQARKVAPDASTRVKVDEMIAKLEGRSGASAIRTTAAVAKAPATFRGEIERIVRTLPFEGRRVKSVEWRSRLKAIVVVDNSTIGAMGAADKARLLDDLRAGIVTAKVAHHVSGTVQIDLRDAATGRTVATVTD
jgi:tetratricopeptide (TPR) repeat protein